MVENQHLFNWSCQVVHLDSFFFFESVMNNETELCKKILWKKCN